MRKQTEIQRKKPKRKKSAQTRREIVTEIGMRSNISMKETSRNEEKEKIKGNRKGKESGVVLP